MDGKKFTTPNGGKTLDEIKMSLSKQDELHQVFASTKDALKLIDLTKTQSRSFTVYSKDLLRTYMRNPKSYESNLRNLSRFLSRLCFSYKRLIQYNAEMIDLTAQSIIPLIDITKDTNDSKLLKTYYKTMSKTQQMGIEQEILKLLLVAWREDAAYGYVYDDDENGMFFHILDGDYCKISSIEDGVFRFAFDFSYFRTNPTELEYWDSEFQTKYNAYQKDSNLRWQELDYERQICLKINSDDPTMCYPPFAPLFEGIIDLIDMQSIQNVKDQLNIYKLLVARLQPLSGTSVPDDFEVDVDTAIDYYNKLAESLPDCVASCISPLPIEPIEFKGDTTDDVDMISSSTNNLFKTAGGSQILNNEKSGSTIFEAQILCDTIMAITPLLPQIERWVNLYLNYKLGNDHAKVKYLKVSPYTRSSYKKTLLESGQNGLACRLEIAALDGFSPLETLSKMHLENELLKMYDNMIPLSTSYTQSSDSQTTTEKDVDELTDEGSETREQDKNDM